ncbi:uncharacterized protein LOC130165151 [Seriola aureovittata]|uniref:uncharacterized protein LOC130165151 n=1 Tax=Seriola aureovittata TaxID=2871759 RepID=UPI0024BE0A58|nr:uncharacterized protein LOC130165151 [Seriola aureovittata]
MLCSDLDVPMFPPLVFRTVFESFLDKITHKQWMMLAAGNIDVDTVRMLSETCKEILDALTVLIMDVVGPQVRDRVQENNGLPIMLHERCMNYYCVTEDDIHATLGDSLHLSFVETLGIDQDPSITNQLRDLFAVELMRQVNGKLALIKGEESLTEQEEPEHQPEIPESDLKNMVYLIALILKRGTENPESPEQQECSDSSSQDIRSSAEEQELHDFNEEDNTIQSAGISPGESLDATSNFSEGSCQDKMKTIQNVIKDQTENSASQYNCEGHYPGKVTDVEDLSDDDASVESLSVTPERQSKDLSDEFPQRDKTFLIVFLGKLVEHTADSTRTSIYDVDIDGILTGLRDRTGGKLHFTLPKKVGKTHIPVYRKLCREFGSARRLQAAMASNDVTFQDTLVKILKAQLQKSSGETSSFMERGRRFFHRRTTRVTPFYEGSDKPASHLEVIDSPPPNTRKRPAIIRMFSFMAKTLRKPFTSCIKGSQDD